MAETSLCFQEYPSVDTRSTFMLGVPVTRLAPATCGELAQGVLGHEDFLINCPIDLKAKVSVTLDTSGEVTVVNDGIYDRLTHCVRCTLLLFGKSEFGAKIEVHTSIPRGKGLASSTSELAAGIDATAVALGRKIPAPVMAKIITSVDTSDGVFFPGVIRCNHLTGELQEQFGMPPPLAFVIVDTGGYVETVGFDRERARAVARAEQDKLNSAVSMIRRGFRERSPRLIAAGATQSAFVNESVLPKPELKLLLKGTMEAGALGVNCAHTGTVLGVMFDPSQTDAQEFRGRVASLIGSDRILGVHQFIGGGAGS